MNRTAVALLAFSIPVCAACNSPDTLGPLPDSEYPSTSDGGTSSSDASADVSSDTTLDGAVQDSSGEADSGEDAAEASVPGVLVRDSYQWGAYSRDFLTYTPVRGQGSPRPLIVALHGCSQDADTFLNVTHLRQIADEHGVVLLLPEQPSSANAWKCWNWFEAINQARGSGEDGLLAGLILQVEHQKNIDPEKILVTGLSAGGAMALVLAATYPDIVSAAVPVAGCPYKGTPCVHQPSSLTGEQLARLAWDAMGERHRAMKLLVVQGTADSTVPEKNASLIVQQWLGVADLADDGMLDGTVAMKPSVSQAGVSVGGRTYHQDDYLGSDGKLLIRSWTVDGMEHAWPGGADGYPFSDSTGPDVTQAIYEMFFAEK